MNLKSTAKKVVTAKNIDGLKQSIERRRKSPNIQSCDWWDKSYRPGK